MKKEIKMLDVKLDLYQIKTLEKFIETIDNYKEIMNHYYDIELAIKDKMNEQNTILNKMNKLEKQRVKEKSKVQSNEIKELSYSFEYNELLLEEYNKEFKKYNNVKKQWSEIWIGNDEQEYDNQKLYKKTQEFLNIYSDVYDINNNQNTYKKGIKAIFNQFKVKRNMKKIFKENKINIEEYLNNYSIIKENFNTIELFNSNFQKNVNELKSQTQIINIKAYVTEEKITKQEIERSEIIKKLTEERNNLLKNKDNYTDDYRKKTTRRIA